ncbi:MAG: ribosome-associated translation inhibitor RaiA [Thalassolituus sp.]|jgi:putative sigma-54 modulation protein|uniref:Ribosome hibernation promoting factor n=2 Tax=root TaxID=1 RepID=M5DVR3_9GAMM|nr:MULTISPECIES: ribosome-associated translation inhibitor RaiA [Thalassolituus]PCI48376.1 MAG: ribosomal subunit interface protein [Oceanospirillales bacterium]PHQ87737.1 MAG: ribosomal subunit interface protein [Thalassobium sp.]AHK14886.1 ribosome hibernation promoting factor HPF [Thalassolituus oleivorans R6-15]APR65926.1 ribosomal subunit interface protein [Thalassolituus oleivorans]MBQ0728655.1 ribosome-associated translation inhibitor RaiA [Thalassolituus oleivorans]|tara:strand:- start:325 stop:627 length:303 start_codon:yes stop_codon:yes gene_type:complete
MQINISGHHVDVTEAMQGYVEEKMSKLTRHFDNITTGQVTLTVEKGRQVAEATIHVTGTDIHAKSEHDDMYAAIDLMTDKLDRQVLKHKEKTVARLHGQG